MDDSKYLKTVKDIIATRDAVEELGVAQIQQKQRRPEFSKVIVVIVLSIWVVFASYCAVVWKLTTGYMPIEILGYITGIVATALGGYYAKSGYQNSKRQAGTDQLAAAALSVVKSSDSRPAGSMEAGENI